MPRSANQTARVRQRRSRNVDQVKLVWASEQQPQPIGESTLQPSETHGVIDGAPNLLVCGDAASALRSLNAASSPVALCYIDPPFNTGQDFDHYADALAVNDWLALMRDSLTAIRDVLAPDGSVWVHLDDTRQHHARCLLDEVFGVESFIATVIWQKRTSRDNRTAFSSMHDYIHVYAPCGPIEWRKRRNLLPDDGAFANPDNDPRGPWRSVPLSAQAGHATAAQFYTIVSPTGVRHDPPPGRCWTYSEPRFAELVADGRVYWPRGGAGKPRLKRYRQEVKGLPPSTLWMASDVGENADAKREVQSACSARPTFDTPKPEALIERIVHIGSNPGETVVDGFLGSGTTAVVAHRLGRRWICVEQNPRTVTDFALPRLRDVIEEHGGGFVLADVVALETNEAAS